MQDIITTIYCLCDDLLKALKHHDNLQSLSSCAEVMTVPVVACACFGGTWREFGGNMARIWGQHGQNPRFFAWPRLLQSASESLALESLLESLLERLAQEFVAYAVSLVGSGLPAQVFREHNTSGAYVVDSFPVPVCHNIRIQRCKLFPKLHKESFRGYCASKKSYFFGFKVQLLITGQGEPVEFVLTPGSIADPTGFRHLELELPPGSLIHADKGYNDYGEEDLLREAGGIILQPLRKRNAKRVMPPWVEFVSKPIRQQVETAISQITNLFPKRIHAVTQQRLELKLTCFVLAYAISCL